MHGWVWCGAGMVVWCGVVGLVQRACGSVTVAMVLAVMLAVGWGGSLVWVVRVSQKAEGVSEMAHGHGLSQVPWVAAPPTFLLSHTQVPRAGNPTAGTPAAISASTTMLLSLSTEARVTVKPCLTWGSSKGPCATLCAAAWGWP